MYILVSGHNRFEARSQSGGRGRKKVGRSLDPWTQDCLKDQDTADDLPRFSAFEQSSADKRVRVNDVPSATPHSECHPVSLV